MSIRVYVAGPLTKGHVVSNIRSAVEVATQLLDEGYFPFLPHLSHLWDLLSPRGYEEWLRYDLHWLSTCNVLLRLLGESPGADREVREAHKLGIPVVFSIEELRLMVPVLE